jgi:hypothetical protein
LANFASAMASLVELANANDLAMLVYRDGGRLARGTDCTNAVSALRDMPIDQSAQGHVVNRTVVVHGRHQGDDAASDRTV